MLFPTFPEKINSFWPICEKQVFKLFPLVEHNVSTVMRSAFADISVLLVPLDFM